MRSLFICLLFLPLFSHPLLAEEDLSPEAKECLLYDENQDKKFMAEELVPYENYPMRRAKEYFNGLTPLLKDLVIFAFPYTLYPDLNNGDSLEEILFYDDLTIQKVSLLNGRKDELYRLSYGVGGGNGGYFTVVLTGKVKLPGSRIQHLFRQASHTFDGDLNYCDPRFKK